MPAMTPRIGEGLIHDRWFSMCWIEQFLVRLDAENVQLKRPFWYSIPVSD